jgi:hypothetical protein
LPRITIPLRELSHYVAQTMICIYCQTAEATTHDHVPPKQLLRKPYPLNLLTVPSCEKCNNGYSADEEYFRLIIVGLLCHTSEAELLFDGPLSRSMNRRPHLEDLMFDALSLEEGGVALDVDYDRIHLVADKIAKGLRFATKGLLTPPLISYSIQFGEINKPTSTQTSVPDFTYTIHGEQALFIEFTFYQSVHFRATTT